MITIEQQKEKFKNNIMKMMIIVIDAFEKIGIELLDKFDNEAVEADGRVKFEHPSLTNFINLIALTSYDLDRFNAGDEFFK